MDDRPWWVYMIECRGGFIYTGVSPDPDARFEAHVAGRGARFTRINKPLFLIGRKSYPNRSSAMREEHRLRKLRPREKRWWAIAADCMARAASE